MADVSEEANDIEKLYEYGERLNEAKDKSQNVKDYEGIIRAARGSIKAKQLAAQLIPRFFKFFPSLSSLAVEAHFDLCEEEELGVRVQAIRGLPLFCKDTPEYVSKIVDILGQLLTAEENVERDAVHKALMSLLRQDVKASLTALFKHIESTDEPSADESIREKVLSFIKDKVFPLKSELLKPQEQMERHITDLVKKSLQDVTGAEFKMFMDFLRSLTIFGENSLPERVQELIEIIEGQADLDAQFNEHSGSLQTEFSNEVELLAKIEHRNLVKLLGYVDKGNEHIIITEFVPNGTLREHLDGQRGKILDFNQRLEISIDVAHALTYLHLYSEKQIIHRDVKSSNILLTESLRAKVADFGFARLGPMEADQTHIQTKVKGTVGYLDPEYLRTYQLTPKSDVYSFGILLIEILTGRRPVEMKRAADERITVRWAFKKYNEGNVAEMLDPLMEDVVDAQILVNMFDLAFQCAAPTRSDRPNMKEVGEQLWGIRMDYLRSGKKG